MTYNFGDSFDFYATNADMLNGYWDTMVGSWNGITTGRFPGSRSIGISSTGLATKSSGANDAVHHLVCAVEQTTAFGSGGIYLTLYDGATAQCTVSFQGTSTGGNIVLTAGTQAGAVLATYASANPLLNIWNAFEIEVVIHPTAGSFTVRKNGNSVADFTATGLNTRASANSYANKLGLGSGTNGGQLVDDLFWQSGATAGAWLGDLRCLTRMPVSDQSVQWSRSGTISTWVIGYNWSTTAPGVGGAYYTPFTPPFSGPLSSLTFNINAAITGHIKLSIYDNTGPNGTPGAPIGSTITLTNPPAGANVVAITGISVNKGQLYYLGLCGDVAVTYQLAFIASPPGYYVTTNGYAAFPVTNPPGLSSGTDELFTSFTVSPTSRNADYVNEAQEDGSTTYVFDSNPGDQDFYGIQPGSAFTTTPFTTIAVISRAFVTKTDAGTRTASLQAKSGATVVASPTVVLTPLTWQWAWRIDAVDPATSAAWTAAAVDALQVGPKVVA